MVKNERNPSDVAKDKGNDFEKNYGTGLFGLINGMCNVFLGPWNDFNEKYNKEINEYKKGLSAEYATNLGKLISENYNREEVVKLRNEIEGLRSEKKKSEIDKLKEEYDKKIKDLEQGYAKDLVDYKKQVEKLTESLSESSSDMEKTLRFYKMIAGLSPEQLKKVEKYLFSDESEELREETRDSIEGIRYTSSFN